MAPFILPLVMFSLLLGTLLATTGSNWFLAWMGLEINTLAILPLMIQQYHPRAIEAITKYFFVQAAGTAMVLFSAMVKAWATGQWGIQPPSESLSSSLMIVALALKMGLAPLHSWLPDVLQGLNFTTGAILSTWQKIAPMTLMIQTASNDDHPHILLIMGMLSVLVGGLGGLSQIQTRKIMAYSSIAHMGWMMLVLPLAPNLTTLALVVYIFTTYSMFTLLNSVQGKTISSLAISWAKNNAILISVPVVLFSLAGLPPLLGFMPKWLILKELVLHNMAPLAFTAAMSSLISFYFYLRLVYTFTLTKAPNNTSGSPLWRLQMSTSNPIIPLSVVLLTMLLPATPMIIALFTSN